MSFPFDDFQSKQMLIQSLSLGQRGGHNFQNLLDGLSTKELRILRKHEDLCDRISEITKLTDKALLETLKGDHKLVVENYHDGGIWVGTDPLLGNFPAWHKSTHCGWYLTAKGGEYEDWARNFLMQEVRINIWIRYMEHKKGSNRQEDLAPSGMHL